MTTVKQVAYPQDIIDSAKIIAQDYFVLHKNEVDFLNKGFNGIPNLFSFAFLAEQVDARKERARNILNRIDEINNLYETNKSAGTLESNAEIVEEFESLENFLDIVEQAKAVKLSEESILNPSLDDLSPYAAVVIFKDENLYKKGSKVLLNSFTIEKGLITQDGLSYFGKDMTYRKLFETLLSIGFSYDKENCALKDLFSGIDIEIVPPSDKELEDIYIRDELADLIKADDDWGMMDYVREHSEKMKHVFANDSLVSYCIEMNKPLCFLESLVNSSNLVVTPSGKLDPAIKRAVFSVAYRGYDFDRFLGKFFKFAKFDDLSQEIIDELVKESFHDLRQEMSLDVFNLYKDKIDSKKLCLALVKHNNVYRMEIPEMRAYIEKAFKDYKDDILKTENIVSHLNYYKETIRLIEMLHEVPTISINGNNVLHYLYLMLEEKEEELKNVDPNNNEVDMINGKIATKVEHIQDEINVINSHIDYFSKYITYNKDTTTSGFIA